MEARQRRHGHAEAALFLGQEDDLELVGLGSHALS
jgi:hypothetical protein